MKLIDTSSKTNWKFIAIVVVLGLVVGGAILWYGNLPTLGSQPIQISQTQKPQAEQVVDISNSSTSLTAGWQTYRSDTRGTIIEGIEFEVKYPEGFELENNERDYDLTISRGSEYSLPGNFVTVFDPMSVRKSEIPYESYLTWRDQFSVDFVKGQTAKEFAEYAYKHNEDYRKDNSTPLAQSISVGDFQETTIGNYQAYTFQCDSHCSVIPWTGVLSVGSPHRAIYLQEKEFVFILLVTEKPIFNQILSTFRFVETK